MGDPDNVWLSPAATAALRRAISLTNTCPPLTSPPPAARPQADDGAVQGEAAAAPWTRAAGNAAEEQRLAIDTDVPPRKVEPVVQMAPANDIGLDTVSAADGTREEHKSADFSCDDSLLLPKAESDATAQKRQHPDADGMQHEHHMVKKLDCTMPVEDGDRDSSDKHEQCQGKTDTIQTAEAGEVQVATAGGDLTAGSWDQDSNSSRVHSRPDVDSEFTEAETIHTANQSAVQSSMASDV